MVDAPFSNHWLTACPAWPPEKVDSFGLRQYRLSAAVARGLQFPEFRRISQHRRIREYDRTCQRERRLTLLVLRGPPVADIILDTYPAGYRLTDAAANEIAALFDRMNPTGRNWSITNNCLAVIRRVPAYRAEEVAALDRGAIGISEYLTILVSADQFLACHRHQMLRHPPRGT